MTSAIELEAIGIVESQIQSNSGKIPDIIIVSNDDWHEGVLGIMHALEKFDNEAKKNMEQMNNFSSILYTKFKSEIISS